MFRFTIRDVLWLTVVVGLAFAWLRDRAHYTEARLLSVDPHFEATRLPPGDCLMYTIYVDGWSREVYTPTDLD